MRRAYLAIVTTSFAAMLVLTAVAQPPRGQDRPAAGGALPAVYATAPKPRDDVEKHILETLEEMRRGPRFANVPVTDGRLLWLLAESIGAQRVVEVGTSTGESAVWLSLALRRTGGHLWTHEIHEGRAKIAQANFERARVDDLITLVLGDAHTTVDMHSEIHSEPIDMVFLDADKDGYILYLEKLLPVVRPGGLIVAHNMNPRQADPRYLEAITQDPGLETAFLYMDAAGVGVTMKKR